MRSQLRLSKPLKEVVVVMYKRESAQVTDALSDVRWWGRSAKKMERG